MEDNSFKKLLKKTFSKGTGAYLPHVAVNSVVFGYQHPNLKVMVIQLSNQNLWSLPGGFVKRKENLEEAAYRNLKLTGIDEVFLKQIRTFGDPHRVPEFSEPKINYSPKIYQIMQWISQRFITVVYYGLVDFKNTNISAHDSLFGTKWIDVNETNNLIQDHANIIAETRKLLITELLNHPIALNLLPETFTMNELRGLYEAILDRTIDRGTFRRKILKQGLIEQVDKRKDAAGRPSFLFRFKEKAYQSFLAEETKFGF